MATGLHGDHHTVGDIYPGYALRRSDASKLKLLDPMHSDDGGWSLLLRNADDNGAASLCTHRMQADLEHSEQLSKGLLKPCEWHILSETLLNNNKAQDALSSTSRSAQT